MAAGHLAGRTREGGHDTGTRAIRADGVGLSGGARRDYWTLSGGERQRALLARALVRRPTLLLLDEPTTYLDRDGERLMLEVLGELERDEGVTLVLVTHDERIARRYATHVALLGEQTLAAGDRATMLAALEAGPW